MRKQEKDALQALLESLKARESRLESRAKLVKDERLYLEHQIRRAGIAEARLELENVLRNMGATK